MMTNDYLAAINAPGIGHFGVEWQSDTKPAAAHKARRLRKVTTAMVMTGAEYRNLAVNNGVETGELPWGEWAKYPFVVEHKGESYARLYTIDGTVRTIYTVDGEVVSREAFNAYLTPSQANAKRPNGGTITVKMTNMRLVGEPAAAGR